MSSRRARLTRIGLLATLVVCVLPAGTGRASNVAPAAPWAGLAEQGAAAARKNWLDKRQGWYRERLGGRSPASLWSAVPLFEALSGSAAAAPTSRNLRALHSFARGARRYWNSAARGYGPYPAGSRQEAKVWFDDNGWWGMAFANAYQATGEHRYLTDARRAFRFIARQGWASDGGLWWNTARTFKAGESLASASFLAAQLYRLTGKDYYRAAADKFVAWGDEWLWNEQAGLYARSDRDPAPLSYVEGPLIAAHAVLCLTTNDLRRCQRAETLAENARAWFGEDLHWAPQYDAILLRGLLLLFTVDHEPKWYELAKRNAVRAASNAKNQAGLYLLGWDGRPIRERWTRPGMLQTHASTLSLFAWLAATPPP